MTKGRKSCDDQKPTEVEEEEGKEERQRCKCRRRLRRQSVEDQRQYMESFTTASHTKEIMRPKSGPEKPLKDLPPVTHP